MVFSCNFHPDWLTTDSPSCVYVIHATATNSEADTQLLFRCRWLRSCKTAVYPVSPTDHCRLHDEAKTHSAHSKDNLSPPLRRLAFPNEILRLFRALVGQELCSAALGFECCAFFQSWMASRLYNNNNNVLFPLPRCPSVSFHSLSLAQPIYARCAAGQVSTLRPIQPWQRREFIVTTCQPR